MWPLPKLTTYTLLLGAVFPSGRRFWSLIHIAYSNACFHEHFDQTLALGPPKSLSAPTAARAMATTISGGRQQKRSGGPQPRALKTGYGEDAWLPRRAFSTWKMRPASSGFGCDLFFVFTLKGWRLANGTMSWKQLLGRMSSRIRFPCFWGACGCDISQCAPCTTVDGRNPILHHLGCIKPCK